MRRALIAFLLASACMPAIASPLDVTSEPAGGTVFLDDRYLGTTPLSIDVPAEGEHLIRVERRGFVSWRGTVTLGAEATRVEATLQTEALGSISASTDPDGADVYIDGVLTGKSPLTVPDLPLGGHQVQVSAPGFLLKSQDVVLTPEQLDATLEFTLSGRIEQYLIAHVEAHPEDVMALTDLAHEYALRNQFDECLDALGKAFDSVAIYIDQLDGHEIRRVYQEVERLSDKQYEYASDEEVSALRPRLAEALRAAIERHPENGYTYDRLGDVLTTLGQTDEALEVYKTGAEKAQSLAGRIKLLGVAGSTLYARGTAAEKAQDWAGAIAAYTEVTTTYPEHWTAENAWGRIAQVQGQRLTDPAASLDAVRKLDEHFPNSLDLPVAMSRTAQAFLKATDYETYIVLSTEMGERFPDYAQTPSMLARSAAYAAKQLADPDRAIALYRQLFALGNATSYASSGRRQAAAILRKQGDEEGAAALEQEILDRFPLSQDITYLEKDPEKRKHIGEARKAYTEATKLAKAGSHGEAVARCEAIIAEYGRTYWSVTAQKYIVNIWTMAKDWERASAAGQAFAKAWPHHPEAAEHLYQAAYSIQTQIGDLPRAIEAHQACVDQYPDDTYAASSLYQMAYVQYRGDTMVDYEKAMEAFMRLARDFPRHQYAATSRKYAADCQMQLRDPEKARAMFVELMEEDPNSYLAYLASSGHQLIRMRNDSISAP